MWWYLCQMCKKFGQNRPRNAQIQYKDRAFQFLSMDRNDLNLNTHGSHVKPRDHCIIVYNVICHGETVLFSSSSLFWKARKWKSREIGAHVTQSVHTSQVNNSLDDSVMYMIRFRIFDTFGIFGTIFAKISMEELSFRMYLTNTDQFWSVEKTKLLWEISTRPALSTK